MGRMGVCYMSHNMIRKWVTPGYCRHICVFCVYRKTCMLDFADRLLSGKLNSPEDCPDFDQKKPKTVKQ